METLITCGGFLSHRGVPQVIIHIFMGFSLTKTLQPWGIPGPRSHHGGRALAVGTVGTVEKP